MSSKSKYAVVFPPIYSRLDLVIIGFFVILNVMYTLFSPPPHIAMYGWSIAIVFIPCIWTLIWVKTFKIEVNGTRISVRRRLGLVRYSFDISEIVRVEAKAVDSGVGRLYSMRVFIPGGRNVPIDILLVNANRLMNLIEANVEPDKIHRVHKSAVNRKKRRD